MMDARAQVVSASATPTHSQIRRALAEVCRSQLSPDDAVPSERELTVREIGRYNANMAPHLEEMDPRASLYATLAREHGLVVDTAEQLAYARTVQGRQALLLGVPDGRFSRSIDRRSLNVARSRR